MRLISLCILAVCACGPSIPAKSANGSSLVCENEFHLDALNVTGGGGFAAVRIDGSVETKAIRQISESVVSYGVQAKRLCEEFNGGVLTRDEYSMRSENLRRRLAGVPELKDSLEIASKSGDAAAKKKALRAAYSELVPDESRGDFTLDFTADVAFPSDVSGVPTVACAQKLKREEPIVIQHGDSVPSGALMSFRVKVTRPAYVYLFQQNEKTKEITPLFPSPRIPIGEPLGSDRGLRIPHESAGFCVNEKDIGMERVYVVASLEPVVRLDKFAQATETRTSGLGLEAMNTTPKSGGADCPRALELVENAIPQCVRGRGLVLVDSDTKAKTAQSFRAVTEAGDSTIVKVFAFDHVTPGEYQKRGPQGVTGRSRGIMIEE